MSSGRLAAARELENAAVLDRHRQLLAAFRNAAGPLWQGLPEISGLRATVAMLRERVLPLATSEECCLAPGPPLTAGSAHDLAFLRSEIDAIAAAVPLLATPAGDEEALAARIRCHFERIEAVLELRVLRAEDFDEATVATLAPPLLCAEFTQPGTHQTRGPQTLTREEIDSFLERMGWGILATVGEGTPYAVPISYGWNGSAAYLACAPGQKARYLESKPVACLTVAEVESGERWRSVVVRGYVRWITSAAEQLAALRILHRQRGARGPSLSDLARMARARFACLEPTEISGRERG